MKELELKYGCNPSQKPAAVYVRNGQLPFEVLSGRPGYINLMDALNSWQLVRELKQALGLPAAASFKHVSPAGAALGLPLTKTLRDANFVTGMEISPLAAAYVRARGADRVSSYGDWAALSEICDEQTAAILAREVSDGVIAPGYAPEALEILKRKKKGAYNILRMDPDYEAGATEIREIFGVSFEQGRNTALIDESLLTKAVTNNTVLTDEAKRDLIIALITLKYTQSNSVCYVKDAQAIGIGAGQQSRIHCTRLAGLKADTWYLRQHPAVLALPFRIGLGRAERDNVIDVYISEDSAEVLEDWELYFRIKPDALSVEAKREWLDTQSDVSLGSDAFFPFGDNVERAVRSGVRYIAQPGGSVRDDDVIDACNKYGVFMAFTGLRLFHH